MTATVLGRTYPVVPPSWRDPRMHLAAVIWSLQVLGLTALGFRVSIAQILITLATCSLLDMAVEFRKRRVIMWPASALLTANGIAFILRVPGTEHGDWWSLHGWWVFAGTAALAIATKHLIRFRGRHVFNPSNVALVTCFLVLGESRAEPLDFWWGPMLSWVALGLVIIVLNGLVILWRVGLLRVALGFWVAFAAGLAVITLADHAMTARWHLGPITGWAFWSTLVTSPEVLLFMFFMITDPKTVPRGRLAPVAFAVTVGLLGALLIAPARTEFGAKVGLLSALTIACAARPLMEHFVPERLGLALRRLAPRPAVALVLAPLVYVAVLLAAGTPARLEGRALAATTSADGLPPVTILRTSAVASGIDRPVALRAARDALAGAGARDPALRRVRRIEVGLARRPGQAGPAILVTLHGVAVQRTFEMAPAGGGYRIAAERTASDQAGVAAPPPSEPIAARVERVGPGSVPQGGRFGFRVVLRNPAAASAASTVALRLVAPGGASVAFHEEAKLVPGRGQAVLRLTVTPSTWFAALGAYEIAATVDGSDVPERLRVTVTAAPVTVPRFEDVTDAAGVRTTVPAPSCGRFSSGAAWGDADGDGNLDLFVTRLGEPARLYMGDGLGAFREQAAARGVAVRDATGAAFADADGDGRADLFVARAGRPSLLLRNEGRRFADVTRRAGIAVDANASGAAWADIDGDGDLDLYVANYVRCLGAWNTGLDELSDVRYSAGRLYRNDGDGTFTDVTARLGGHTKGAAFAAAFFDADGDGRQDLYVANDFVGQRPDANRLWRNLGSGRLRDVSERSGTALFMNAMGIGVGDPDRDGRLDLAVSNIAGNRLLHNAGDGTFTDLAGPFGVARPLQRTGTASVTWGVGFADLNLDGWEDLYFGAGNISRPKGSRLGPQPNQLFVSDGSGARMLDLSAPSGAADPGDTKGVAFADYDRDGRVDLLLVDQGGAPRLLRNVTPRGDAHWLEVAAAGRRGNREGCGARVEARLDDGPPIVREIACGGASVGSGSDAVAHLGLGPAVRVRRLQVTWPTGARRVLRDVAVDRLVRVSEPAR